MKLLKTTWLILASVLMVGCSSNDNLKSSLIPMPSEMDVKSVAYELDLNKGISVNDQSLDGIADLLAVKTENTTVGITLELLENESENKEAYTLNIDGKGVQIKASSPEGVFYGVQTLLQLMEQNKQGEKYILPYVSISDEPRFVYRGMHLDVSRNFYDVAFVKKYIDILAMFKFNRFHWHLTDGAGWRIEIKKYPELTRKAAFREKASWKEFWFGDRKFAVEGDENAYGGYYTQEQIKEVVAYAQSKYITIIPEIEMPGHSEEVFVAYPDLCCSKKQYGNSDFCAGNEKTFEFIEGVLSEVIGLFPSEYIHLGGDEAGKGAWEKCTLCKRRMQANNLKDVDELQSYFMHRVEKFVNSKGRKMIGWDEIIEGGLSETATVMSWRGEEGGIKAAKQGNDVVMAPGAYCYFDGYQANPMTEPEAIGGFLPLRKVYSYQPMPKDLTTEEQKHIIGIQACIWAEYIASEEHMLYMMLPRAIALAEVAWSKQEDREWDDFKSRLFDILPMLDAHGINYHKPNYEMEMNMVVDQEKEQIDITFETEQDAPDIRYTTDGSIPTATSAQYDDKIELTGNNLLKAAIFEDGVLKEPILEKPVNYHKAIGAKVTYKHPIDKSYPAGGDTALVNGYRGGMGYNDGFWQGFTVDLDVIIDLGSAQDINRVSATFMQLIGPWVYMPSYVEVSTSLDGEKYEKAFRVDNDVPQDKTELVFKDFEDKLESVKARYIHFFAKNPKGYIFTDEIIVE